MITKEDMLWSFIKFSQLILQGNDGDHMGEFAYMNIGASRVKTFLGIMLSSLFYLFWPPNVNFLYREVVI